VESAHLAEYLAEHDYATLWAVANRDLVAHRIMSCLYHPSHEQADTQQLPHGKSGIPRKIIDVTHNSVTKHTLTIAGVPKEVWVHRKGAAPTDKGVVICPGSRGDFSWLLIPTGDGQHNGELVLVYPANRVPTPFSPSSTVSCTWSRSPTQSTSSS
jgi:release factor H-coupled RctB family protein